MAVDFEETEYGFRWGPMTVTRRAEMDGRCVVSIDAGSTTLHVYVSATGRSVRVWRKGHGEMTTTGEAETDG